MIAFNENKGGFYGKEVAFQALGKQVLSIK